MFRTNQENYTRCRVGSGGARIAMDTAQSGWEGEALSSGKLEKRAGLQCILEKEPKGLGVGRGREKGSWVDVEVRSGFQAPSCPEDRLGGGGTSGR